MGRSAAVVVLAPPTGGKANTSLGTLLASVKAKQRVVVAESYGGDDEPVDTITQRFVEQGLVPAFEPMRVRETPTEAT